MNFAFLRDAPPRSNGRSVAVIGAGPSGLAATGFLAGLGYKVRVFDKLPKAGGLMVFGIPAERIPEQSIAAGVKRLEQDFGVEFKLRTKICGSDAMHEDTGDHFSSDLTSLGELTRDHDAVIICTGSWRPRKMNIPGEDLPGVYSGLEFLFPIRAAGYDSQKLKAVDVTDKTVLVIGAGFSAVDVALAAQAHGAAQVKMLYRRTRHEAPCGIHDVCTMEDAGCEMAELVTPVRVLGTDRVTGVEVVQCQLGEPDASGRRCSLPDSCAKAEMDADIVVAAIGEIAAPPFAEELGLDKVRKNEVHWLHMTKLPGVFVAGDALTGPSKIGKAVYSGLKAAKSLAAWLSLKAEDREDEYSDDEVITPQDWHSGPLETPAAKGSE
ncbi:MAG: glutamate synthase [Desulfovibrio sp.]|nr:MAG: glutamate synthase [Desulfovibrio sp.]